MTTLTEVAPRPRTASAPAPRVGLREALDAEWTKIRSVRSTFWTMITMVVASVGLTALVCAVAAADLANGTETEPVGAFVTWGLLFGQIAALVLGVLVMSAEFSSGMIRTTLSALPRRGRVIAAKAVVLAGLLFVLGTITAFASFLAGNAFLSAEGIGLSFSDDGVLRALVGSGLYLAVLGLFGFGLALLMRHTAGAVTVGIAMVFVIGNLVGIIPGATGEWLMKLSPGNAGSTLATVESFNPILLSPWTGFAVFVAETLALIAFGFWRFKRRDA